MRAAQAALTRDDGAHSFIERFWESAEARRGGATCRVKIGAQIGNRVGHVQGGILLGIAQATARRAVPQSSRDIEHLGVVHEPGPRAKR